MTITRRLITDDRERMEFLPKKLSLVKSAYFEVTVFNFARQFSQDYDGGLWVFAELSNGGFFIFPDGDKFRFVNSMNGADVIVSAEAFGVIVSLIAMSALSFEDHEYADRYHQLLDYAGTMDERSKIYAAID